MKRLFMVLSFVLMLTGPAWGCIGRTLTIGVLSQPREQMVATVLSVFISERTGTTVVMKSFSDPMDIHQALLGGVIDLTLSVPTAAWRTIMGREDPLNRTEIRDFYLSTFNLVWGVATGASPVGSDAGATENQYTPVLRRDTLVKFPALPKLLRKLDGRIDNQWLKETVKAGFPEEEIRDRLARDFLRELRLI